MYPYVQVYTLRELSLAMFLKCLYFCCIEKYYNTADHIQLV